MVRQHVQRQGQHVLRVFVQQGAAAALGRICRCKSPSCSPVHGSIQSTQCMPSSELPIKISKQRLHSQDSCLAHGLSGRLPHLRYCTNSRRKYRVAAQFSCTGSAPVMTSSDAYFAARVPCFACQGRRMLSSHPLE